MSEGTPVWLISGCSTGIGREIADVALAAGERVVVTARKVEAVEDFVRAYPETALALPLDVTQADQVRAVVGAAEERFGRVDVLVNNAGYGYVSSVEEGVDEDVRRMFDTNFFGAIDLIKAVLPGMRARRSGFIANISSMTGLVSNPANVYYSSSKFALESLSEGLAKEVIPFGIRVTAIEPGLFRTDWSSRSMQESPTSIPDYEPTIGVRREMIRNSSGGEPGDPRKVGEATLMLSRLESPPVRIVLGADVLGAIRQKLTDWQASLDEWESVSLDVGFPEDSQGD